MATNAGTLEVVITATTAGLTAGIANARDALNKAGPSLKMYGALLAGTVVAGLTASVYAFGEAQKSASGLSNVLKNQGVTSREVLNSLLKYAEGLQQLSGFSDESIVDAEKMLVTHGLLGEELKKVTKLAVDMAAHFEMTVPEAAELLGKAIHGETGRLAKFGVVVDENTPKVLRGAEALKKMAALTEGAGAAKGKTFLGMLGIAAGDVSNFAEEIGRNLVPVVQRFVKFMIDNRTVLMQAANDVGRSIVRWTDDFMNVISWIRSNKSAIKEALFGAGLGALAGAAGGPAGAIGGALLFGALGAWVGKKNQPGGEFISPATRVDTKPAPLVPAGLGAAGGADKDPEEAPKKFGVLWKDTFDKTFGAGKMMADNIALVMNGAVSAIGTGLNGFLTDMLIQGKSLVDALQNLGLSLLNSVLGVISQMLAKWIVAKAIELTVHKTTEAVKTGATLAGTTITSTAHTTAAMRAVTENAAVAKTSVMAAHAGIPFVGIAIGLAAVAVITGILASLGAFAEGGIATGPTLGLFGEAGTEAIIPLEKGKEMGLFGNGGGGGQGGGGVTEVHLHFDGATLVEGDETKWENIARRHIIPALAAYQDKTRSSDFRRWPTRT